MALSALRDRIVSKTAMLTGFEKTRDAMIELMRHHNIESIQDPHRFAMIRNIFDFEASRIEATNQEIKSLTTELVAGQQSFAKLCLVESNKVNRLLIPLLVAARMELELSIGEEQFAKILNETHPQLEKQFDDFIRNISPIRDETQKS